MPRSKKLDKNKKKSEASQDLQQDHEQFLLAFEKPTQIYRFLRARQILSPTFMHRTLLYMRDRCSRTNARRNKFAVKDLLSIAPNNVASWQQNGSSGNEDLQIIIAGLALDPAKKDSYLLKDDRKIRRVDVEVLVSRTIMNKRKDIDFTAKDISYGVVEVSVNSKAISENSNLMDHEDIAIVIPASEFTRNTLNEGVTKSYTLKFRIREASFDCDISDESESSDSDATSYNEETEESQPRKKKKLDDADDEEEEADPAGISLKNLTTGPRKRKSRYVGLRQEDQNNDGPECNTRSRDTKEEQPKSDKKQKVSYYGKSKSPVLKKNPNLSKDVISETELLLFNGDFECQAETGSYELVLNKKELENADYKRKAVWESFDGGREVKVYGSFSSPTLELNLKWCPNANPGPLADADNEEEPECPSWETNGRRTRNDVLSARQSLINGDGHSLLADKTEYRKCKFKEKMQCYTSLTNGCENATSNSRVYYQFMYNNNTQQQTESRNDFYCPWCQLNCMTLYGLMKHLKLCHPRFLFRYSQQNKGVSIIVTVNECYDGSYAGNPQNIFCQPGMAFSRRGPVRRIPVTDVLVYTPQRKPIDPNCSLAELLDKEDVDALEPTQLSTGHRRLYFHSLTALPIRPCEFDVDSEEESAEPDWLFGHTKRMIDEFTDVNEGEKALMKIWNLHIMRNCCISDVQMEEECRRFIDRNIFLLCKHSLRSNLLLHFVCLVDFGVFKTSGVMSLMDYYDGVENEFLKANPDIRSTDHSAELTSPDFPEPDLLPRMKQLQEVIQKYS